MGDILSLFGSWQEIGWGLILDLFLGIFFFPGQGHLLFQFRVYNIVSYIVIGFTSASKYFLIYKYLSNRHVDIHIFFRCFSVLCYVTTKSMFSISHAGRLSDWKWPIESNLLQCPSEAITFFTTKTFPYNLNFFSYIILLTPPAPLSKKELRPFLQLFLWLKLEASHTISFSPSWTLISPWIQIYLAKRTQNWFVSSKRNGLGCSIQFNFPAIGRKCQTSLLHILVLLLSTNRWNLSLKQC